MIIVIPRIQAGSVQTIDNGDWCVHNRTFVHSSSEGFHNHSAEFLNFQNPPAVCFIQLGGNDLCHAKPGKVTTDILSYALYLKDCVDIRNVVIGQLLRRQPWASRASYNVDVVNVNRQLKSEVEKRQGIHFWTHRGFWTDLTYLGRDVVHIDAASRHMKKYLHSIRIAVLHHSR